MALLHRVLCFVPGSRCRGRRRDARADTRVGGEQALLTQNVFVSKKQDDRVNQISRAVSLAVQADQYLAACRRAKRQPTAEEQKVIDAAEELREQIIQVPHHT